MIINGWGFCSDDDECNNKQIADDELCRSLLKCHLDLCDSFMFGMCGCLGVWTLSLMYVERG